VIWNVEEGLKLDPARIARAQALRSDLYRRMREFMERHDFLCMPVNQVPPFPAAQPFVDTINGVKLADYIAWMKTAYYVTCTSHPAISVPAGQAWPSRWRAAHRTAGSTWRNVSNATSRPATTQSAFSNNTPRAISAGATVASVVMSPSRTSSSSARRTMSR